MELNHPADPSVLEIRPATLIAFIKTFPFLLYTLGLLLLAWYVFPALTWLSLATLAMACYRFIYIRRTRYLIILKIIRVQRGIFFKRIDQMELWRVKDYVITQSFLLQILRLMDVTLKGTDPENPVIWLRGIPCSDLVDTLRERVNEARQRTRLYELN
jgi:uncharacterized membrane protein YdbT with pleckstrin-like domain